MRDQAIVMDGLSRTFETVQAVDSLSLMVPRGTIFGFLGPNGAGKTTTIRLLLGLLEPSAGRAEVLGHDTRTEAAAIRAQTGALLEHTGIYEQLTAEENLEFYGRVYGLSAAERRARSQELLTEIGLWERRKERAGDWSRGMRQKLALARVLLHRPPLVLLDEPTAGLDVVAANDVRDKLDGLAERQGVTIFLTTHNMSEAERLCDDVAVIREGKLVAQGSPDALRTQTSRPKVEIVGRNFNEFALQRLRDLPVVAGARTHNGHLEIDLRQQAPTAPLVNLLVEAGVEVEEIHRGQASLEDVFVTLMEEEA
jgi:ABC-2 type transport system ATP-binding protein